MRFKMKFGSGRKLGSRTSLVSVIGNFWQKIYRYLFFACVVLSMAAGAYVWQRSLLNEDWSIEKKQEYLNSQDKGIILKEKDYKKALADVELRKNAKTNPNSQGTLKDIFKDY